MNYDNIIYPLDKIYSQVTGVGYPVSGAGGVPTPDPKTVFFHITNISNEVGELSLGGNYTRGYIEYSFDCENWNTYDLSTKPSVSVEPECKIYLRGTNFLSYYSTFIRFSQEYTVGGNFMSISNYETMEIVDKIEENNSIGYAFWNQTNLVSAADLNFGNVKTIGSNGLSHIFSGCSSLTACPNFSNFTYIGDYGLEDGFRECVSLLSAPDFSHVTSVGRNGLQQIFMFCSALKKVSDFSNLTSIGDLGLHNSFRGCTSLLSAPNFPKLTSVGIKGLDTAFYQCTFTTGPDFSNVTSAGENAFRTSLALCNKLSTVTAPNIQDLTQNGVLEGWLENSGDLVTGTKTVRVPTGATISTNSNSGIPSGWTRTDY